MKTMKLLIIDNVDFECVVKSFSLVTLSVFILPGLQLYLHGVGRKFIILRKLTNLCTYKFIRLSDYNLASKSTIPNPRAKNVLN